jgi:hypothetical protein
MANGSGFTIGDALNIHRAAFGDLFAHITGDCLCSFLIHVCSWHRVHSSFIVFFEVEIKRFYLKLILTGIQGRI